MLAGPNIETGNIKPPEATIIQSQKDLMDIVVYEDHHQELWEKNIVSFYSAIEDEAL